MKQVCEIPHTRKRKYFWPVVVGILFIGFFIAVSLYYMYQLRKTTDVTISGDIERLSKIFESISNNCVITKFDREKNNINFLNIKSFAGNKVGSMTLEYPEKWQGPYLVKELQIDSKPYQIALTKQGYYITPPEGVRLPNGKIIGKDIILTAQTDIETMLKSPEQLLGKNNKPLAARVKTKQDPFDLLVPKNVFAFR